MDDKIITSFRFDEELYKWIKVYCVNNDISVTELIEMYFRELKEKSK